MANSFFQSPIAKKLEGKVAIITGGASGIGAATARLFVQHGAKVVIADIQNDLGNSLVKQIGTEQTIIYVHCNVSIESDVKNVVDATIAKFGKLDIMCSNAGVLGKPISSILDVDHDIIKDVFDVNVVGAFFCAKHAARVMIPNKKGVILFTASASTVVFGTGVPHTYASSKNAVLGLSTNVGVELGKYGIRVNCVSPYYISTPLVVNGFGVEEQKADKWFEEGGNLKGALLDEQDVANAMLYLTSDDAKYVSGHNLILDGGFSTTNVAITEAYKKLFPSNN
ncbi:short chain aldehyde dehydrogenase 1-like [Solanum stenotomum]|uniref:short chain aldehyde dehydrogenase 1-like n=1 Tax=Solanum stenotomum TaxID=172797 RepID=UPI0020D1A4F1|nr:short chain aldehyde dehydrogenase 1-like [Solanum stenotomum]